MRVNAALKALDRKEEFTMDRADSYLGVMIDDITTLGVDEPYRLFTSRAEYRLSMRADNADLRLTPRGIEIGCVGAERAKAFKAKQKKLNEARQLVLSLSKTPKELKKLGFKVNVDGRKRTPFDLLSYPNVGWAEVVTVFPELKKIKGEIAEQLEIEGRYQGYLARQAQDIADFKKDEALKIPEKLNYRKVGGLSNEIVERLEYERPATIGAMSRMRGITPASVTAVIGYLKKK